MPCAPPPCPCFYVRPPLFFFKLCLPRRAFALLLPLAAPVFALLLRRAEKGSLSRDRAVFSAQELRFCASPPLLPRLSFALVCAGRKRAAFCGIGAEFGAQEPRSVTFSGQKICGHALCACPQTDLRTLRSQISFTEKISFSISFCTPRCALPP